MIYLTQLIYLKPGKEAIFHEFEAHAIPLMGQYNGRVIYRIRPEKSAFISDDGDQPYEIHFISFDSQKDLDAFLKDDTRLEFMHLKDASVERIVLTRGKRLN